MNKVQNGSSFGREKVKKFHASWRPSCRASAGSYCWTPVAGSFGGWCSPADRWWLIEPLLAAGPLCPGNSFSSTATASEAGAVSQPAPLCWGGSPLLPLFLLVLLLRLGRSHIRLLGSPVAVFWAILALQSATTTTAPSRPQQQLRDRSIAPSTASSSQQQLLVHWPRLLAVAQAGWRSGQQPPPL